MITRQEVVYLQLNRATEEAANYSSICNMLELILLGKRMYRPPLSSPMRLTLSLSLVSFSL